MTRIAHPATPRVFISSNQAEFADFRAALAYVLRSQGVAVQFSEDPEFLVNGNETAIEQCLARAGECDIYVLLIGARTGHKLSPDLSITRAEFRRASASASATGRPTLKLYVKRDVADSVEGKHAISPNYKIDDSAHLRSFIDEVQSRYFLKRFTDFGDVAESLRVELNLGRDVRESALREGLKRELIANLAPMLTPVMSTAVPNHRFMADAVARTNLGAASWDAPVVLTSDDIRGLMLAVVPPPEYRWIRTMFIDLALAEGLFLTFDPGSGQFVTTPPRQALERLRSDIDTLAGLVRNRQPDWAFNIYRAIGTRRGPEESVAFKASDLIFAFGYFNDAENLFNEHLHLLRYLLGVDPEYVRPARRARTPLGPEMQQKIDKERATSEDVERLVRNDIAPLGARQMIREPDFANHAELAKRLASSLGLTDQQAVNSIKELVAKDPSILKRLFATPDEGIDPKSRE